MGTVNKVAAQLQVGDIYTCQGGRAVVVHTVDRGAGGLLLYTAMLGRQPLPVMTPPVGVTPWDATFCVEVPDAAPLTPAQEHAEDLVQVARMVVANRFAQGADILDLASGLLGKIDPPIPPTLAEALTLLGDIERDQWAATGERHKCMQAARGLLDRAKKAGML